MKEEKISATASTGNVFRDLELDDAEELLVKARLAAKISSIIEHRHISQQEAAQLLGTTQPTVSQLVRGELYGFSTDRLLAFLQALGRDIEIHVKKRGRASERGRTVVYT